MERLEGLAGGSGGRAPLAHRRSLSAPHSLDALAEHALGLETSPCSAADLACLEDEVSRRLRVVLHEAQHELLAAVEAGVLAQGGAAPPGRRTTSDSGGAASDADERQRSGGAASGSGGAGPRARAVPADEFVVDESELAGLSARERETAIKRAKNREAARRSRERKVGRIAALQGEVDKLRSNNFVLLKCIEEVAGKALAARAEHKQLRDKLARLGGAPAPAAALLAGAPSSAACTPSPARRAAALERELLRMEAESPTQLLLPQWPDRIDAAHAPAAPHLPRQPLPTSGELRRQLQEAVAGTGRAGSGNDSAGSSGEKKAAADHFHHLHPSPGASQQQRGYVRAPLAPLEPGAAGLPQQLRHQAVLAVKQGPGLLRTCSAPGGLLASAAAGISMAAPLAPGMPEAPSAQPWYHGVAV